MLYASGRCDLAKVESSLKSVEGGSNYLRKNDKGEVVGVNLPKFYEVNINLLRSVITRRRAAQVEKYDRLYPYFLYESRDQTQVGKLRADMVSQRMDVMADQFGYRHMMSQATLHMLLYAHTAAFPRSYWEREVSLEKMPGNAKTEDGKIRTRTRVTREGISWVLPHPSRLFYDNNYPLTSLNEDQGCEYVGFWDVTRWGDIAHNPDYFNRKKVSYTSGMVDWFSTYWAYFNQYFTTIIPPSIPSARGDNVNFTNDRKNQVGLFTGNMEQVSTIFTHLWVKVLPQNWGWGRYPYPIWVHLKVAGDATVVYAKICPSSPAAVFSHNENDARLFNISLAHELMPFQDQLTNLFTQFLETVHQDLLSVCVLNTDVFPDTEEGKSARADFEAVLSGKDTNASMHLLEVSYMKLKELGIDAKDVFTVVRAKPNTSIDKIFESITQLLNMTDRLEVMSPHEQAQAASHEISATESHQMGQSTDTVFNFISTGIDEGRAAIKRICYDSLVSCSENDLELTVANRYADDVVKAAGFKPTGDAMADSLGFTRLMGDKTDLIHDYIFTSRDAGDRPAGSQAAQILVQMLQAIGSFEADMQQAILAAMGKTKLFEIMNTIFRAIDAGIDLKLELKPGEKDELLMSQDEQMKSAMSRMAGMLQKDTQDIDDIHQFLQALTQIIGQSNPAAGQQIAQLMQRLQAGAQKQLQTPQPGGPPGAQPPGQPPQQF
jgi:hypothetical protein